MHALTVAADREMDIYVRSVTAVSSAFGIPSFGRPASVRLKDQSRIHFFSHPRILSFLEENAVAGECRTEEGVTPDLQSRLPQQIHCPGLHVQSRCDVNLLAAQGAGSVERIVIGIVALRHPARQGRSSLTIPCSGYRWAVRGSSHILDWEMRPGDTI